MKPTDTCQVALELMNEMGVAFLPVVADGQHLGYISTGEIVDIRPKTKKIAGLLKPAPEALVNEETHLFDVIRLFSEVQSTVLSVADKEGRFLGIISAKELINHIASFNGFNEPGSIVTLEMGVQDYSLSEISRIVEYNNAKVLSLYLNTVNGKRLQVHIKLNTLDLRSLIATFQRYNYEVVASYFQDDDISDLKDRYDQLMKFLDIDG